MYFIVNKTKQSLILADLKQLELGPRQAIDLDKLYDRHSLDNSKDLHHAIKQGLIQVRQKTNHNHNEEPVQEVKEVVQQLNTEEIKADLRKEFQSQIGELTSALKDSVANPALMGVLEQLKSAISEGQFSQQTIVKEKETVIERPVEGATEISTGVDDTLDPKIAGQIHAKAVDRLAKGSKGKVTYQQDKVEDSVVQNVDELDNLL